MQNLIAVAQTTAGLVLWEEYGDGPIQWWADPVPVYGVKVTTPAQLLALVFEEDRAAVAKMFSNRPPDFDIDYRVKMPNNNEYRWIHSRGLRIGERLVGASINITERKLAEEMLKSSQKVTIVGRLTAAIMHEINNPLESLTLTTYLLASRQDLPDDVKHLLNIVKENVERITEIATTTLNFTRESTKVSEVDLAQLVEDVSAFFGPRASRKHVVVEKKYEHSPQSIIGYQGELRQVLANVIRNAIEAASSRVKVTLLFRKHSVAIMVTDDGNGFSDVKSVGKPFYSTKGEHGTGLGMWISQSIVASHGGSMRYSNKCGACVRICLPYRRDLCAT